jgi:2-methylisocitrate lyase-like PEP mutase family enzyme
MRKTQQLRQRLLQPQPLIAPGAFDGLSARLVEQAGFEAIYASGGAIARSAGYPDLGLLSSHEILDCLAQMAEVTTIPIIADADTGFGNGLNVERTVRQYERLGLAGLHLEDQAMPKRCGHLDDKRLITTDEMVHKIKIAKQSQTDPDFLFIARTDAIAVEGLDAALTRAQAYLAAGADMIFVEAPQTLAQIETIAARLPQPKLINMFYGGKTPLVPLDKLQQLGYQLVIIPSDLQRAAIFAMQQTLAAIRQDGDSHALAKQLTSFNEREKIIDTERYLSL